MSVALYQDGAQLCAYKTNNGHTGVGINAYLGENPMNFSGPFGRVVVNAGRWLLSGPCGTPTPTATANGHSDGHIHGYTVSDAYLHTGVMRSLTADSRQRARSRRELLDGHNNDPVIQYAQVHSAGTFSASGGQRIGGGAAGR